MSIKNLDDLKKFTDEIRSKDGYKDPLAFAIGRVQKDMTPLLLSFGKR